MVSEWHTEVRPDTDTTRPRLWIPVTQGPYLLSAIPNLLPSLLTPCDAAAFHNWIPTLLSAGLAAATHGRSDPNNLAQPWPKCCLLTVIVERKWIDGIWSRAQGFLAMEGGEDVGNCSRCIFYRLKIAEHRLLVQVISSIWGPLCCGHKEQATRHTAWLLFCPFLHFSE